MSQPISRRKMIGRAGSGAFAYLTIPHFLASSKAQASLSPEGSHFILQVIIPGGLDTHYLFDARPLAMTDKKIIQNYSGEEPKQWIGRNDQKTLATKAANPLKPYKDDFSILNGVVMDPTFDGHEQNMAFWYTGNPFGGEFYMPHLNASDFPLDYVDIGTGKVFVQMSNTNKGVPLSNKSVKSLLGKLDAAPKIGPQSHLYKYVTGRMNAIAKQGRGSFSGGAWAMDHSLQVVPGLNEKMSQIHLAAAEEENTKTSIDLMNELFKAGITQSASLVLNPGQDNINVDTHDEDSARAMPGNMEILSREIATVFKTLKETPYDAKRSMLDMTTVLVTSEFGRTMRQSYTDFETTGTDHNSLTNTVLIGGKGIKGGMVVGSSDFDSVDAKISGAHKQFDPDEIKAMGKPFDFETGRSRADRPKIYKPQDYLTASCVINTVYKMFGVPESKYRLLERNGAPAKTLDVVVT